MLHARRVGTWLVAAAVATGLGTGCLRRSNEPPRELLRHPWKEPGREAYTRPETDKLLVENLSPLPTQPAATPVKPLNVLSLSAGGKYAAYSAGILTGWTEQGTRPEFDIVTGVSSGAIISIYAFLGPQYDCKLRDFFTETDQTDLFKIRPFHNLAFHGSLGYPYGLRRIVREQITPQLLGEVAAAHRAGRRLYIGTENVHTKQLVVWDVGGIACRGTPDAVELVQKIVLGATAVPGLLPAVPIDVTVDGRPFTEIHSDAGTVAQSFLRFDEHQYPRPGTKGLAGSQLYCLAAGKIEPDPVTGFMGFLKRIGASLSSSLYSLYKNELVKYYALCATTGMQFNLSSIPPDYPIDERSTRIKAQEMRPLFEEGRRQALAGIAWRQTPPGALTGEEPEPRAGTAFHTIR